MVPAAGPYQHDFNLPSVPLHLPAFNSVTNAEVAGGYDRSFAVPSSSGKLHLSFGFKLEATTVCMAFVCSQSSVLLEEKLAIPRSYFIRKKVSVFVQSSIYLFLCSNALKMKY